VEIQTSPAKRMQLPASRIIIRELEDYLRGTKLRHVHFSDGSTAPPQLAYVTNFPRLSVPLMGCHKMDVAHAGRALVIKPVRGHAVFVPGNAWNKPDWSSHVDVLTFLFGVKQIGISLVRHKGQSEVPASALKASVHSGYDSLTHSLLTALLVVAADQSKGPLSRLLTESLLHSCLRLLRNPQAKRPRKAIRTYESICLFVQQNFQAPMTRESVAEHFGLAANHISRLFREEGMMRFNDYVNLVRMNRAKFMLQNYAITLKEIASNCGYADTAYFCRIFKRMCNLTPTQYRAVTARAAEVKALASRS
jgi:AraC-like DNA-binding protein